MGKDHSSFNAKRKNSRSRNLKKIILYVEGRNTEYSYLKQLKRANCKVEPVPVRGNGIGNCMDFVNTSIGKFNSLPKKEKEKYSGKWMIFDYDGHDDFWDAIKFARKNGFQVAFSSMCIEYWFVLHFENHDGNPIPIKEGSHSKAQIEMINKYIGQYNKKNKGSINLYDINSKEIEDDFFDLLMAEDDITHNRRIIDAYLRAKVIHENKLAVGAECQESVTTVYKLMEELGTIQYTKQKDKYELYNC